MDALFTSTSAVCVTGLIVQDTPTYFTPAGQVIILFLFQLGGLGIMTFSTLILLVAGRSISMTDRVIIQEGYHHAYPDNVKSLIKGIFFYTLILEFLGAALLFIHWNNQFSTGEALFQSAFHAISAFCNAGFSLFSDSFIPYRGDFWVNGVIITLIILGGLGFLVLQEIKKVSRELAKRKKFHVSLHTKMILWLTLILVGGALVFFVAMEWNNALQDLTLKEKILASLFQVVTPRTAGFNTMNLNALSTATVLLLILLMFIGASPGSTAGGIKTTTVGVIGAFIKSKLAARKSVNVFYRTLPWELITRAFLLAALAVCVVFVSTFLLLWIHPQLAFPKVLFEVFSAFGTVGLSLGITPELSEGGKMVIILTMYIGRISPLTLLYVFSRQRAVGRYEYVEETVMIA